MEEVKQKSWMSRNWGWLLGGGCLLAIIIVALVIGGAIWGISKSIGESEPYTHAYEIAIQNEDVKTALGEPIETSFVGSNTKYNYSNGETKIEMTIPLKGSKNDGFIHVLGTKVDGIWDYSKLYVDVTNDDEDINLLEERDKEDDKLEL